MQKWLNRAAVILVLVIVGSYAWKHMPHAAVVTAEQTQPNSTYAEAQEAQKMVVVTGPLADYYQSQKPSNVDTLQPIAHKTSTLDRVGESPVGTGASILNQTFRVKGIVDLPFEIPAHAATPKLHGTYRSFVQQGESSSSDSTADVEFLLLNEKQFSEFLNGHPGDTLFSADSAHDGEVNFSLPPTMLQPAWYYLVFRNGSQGKEKKVVQADFRVDF